MELKKCLCGAKATLRHKTQETANGETETIYWVGCPICGQLGPMVSDRGIGEDAAVAAALCGWDEMLARARPLEA